jgi:hypothetical protein
VKYVQNDPGGIIGGPVLIPHVYDGRNKTFFFVDFNVTLASQGNGASYLVLTDLQKAADFSQTMASGMVVPIYDPKALASDGRTRIQFANNMIPASRIDPVAAQIVKFYPEPNSNINGNNYFETAPSTNDNWQYLGTPRPELRQQRSRLLPLRTVQPEQQRPAGDSEQGEQRDLSRLDRYAGGDE